MNFDGEYFGERSWPQMTLAPQQLPAAVQTAACAAGLQSRRIGSAVVQQHGLNADMVFCWRRQLATGALGEAASQLVPVTAAPTISFGGAIEIRLASATMRIEGTPDLPR